MDDVYDDRTLAGNLKLSAFLDIARHGVAYLNRKIANFADEILRLVETKKCLRVPKRRNAVAKHLRKHVRTFRLVAFGNLRAILPLQPVEKALCLRLQFIVGDVAVKRAAHCEHSKWYFKETYRLADLALCHALKWSLHGRPFPPDRRLGIRRLPQSRGKLIRFRRIVEVYAEKPVHRLAQFLRLGMCPFLLRSWHQFPAGGGKHLIRIYGNLIARFPERKEIRMFGI